MEDQFWNAGLTNPDENIRDESSAILESEPLYNDTTQFDDNYSSEFVEQNKDECYPIGYRFNPYDYELIIYYLRKRIMNQPLPPNGIHEVELYKYNPETLIANYKPNGDQKEWYFLTPTNRKYPNGGRPSRATGDGYWKAAGVGKPVIYNEQTVGSKRTLGFYRGTAQECNKTQWIMHEYKACDSFRTPKRTNNGMRLDDWVLCRIYKKGDKKNGQVGSTGQQDDAAQDQPLENNGALAPPNDAQNLVPDHVTGNYNHGSDQFGNPAYHQNSQNGLPRVSQDHALPSIPQCLDLPLEQTSAYYQNSTVSQEINSLNMDGLVSYETLNQMLHFQNDFPLECFQHENGVSYHP